MKKKLCTKNCFFRIVPNTKSYGASYSRHTRKENFPIARNTHSPWMQEHPFTELS
jgi:hypothetical protein